MGSSRRLVWIALSCAGCLGEPDSGGDADGGPQDGGATVDGGAGGVFWQQPLGQTHAVLALDGADPVIAGSLGGTLILDGEHAAAGARDLLLARFDAVTGAVAFAVDHGGAGSETSVAAAVTPGGEILVSGRYVGGGELGGEPLPVGPGDIHTFVARYTDAGEHIWSIGAQSSLDDVAPVGAIGLGGGTEVAVSGYFDSTVQFSDEAASSVTAEGSDDAFLLVLAATGAVDTLVSYGGGDVQVGASAHLRGDGDIYLAGRHGATFDINGEMVETSGRYGLYAARVSGNGMTTVWAIAADGTDAGQVMHVWSEMTPDGDLVLAGTFNGSLQAPGHGAINAVGDDDVFVMRVSADGEVDWIEGFGGPGEDELYALAVGPDGTVAISGTFTDSVDFGTGPLSTNGFFDVYLAELADDGRVLRARSFGGPLADSVADIEIGPDGALYMTALFRGDVSFGGGVVSAPEDQSHGILLRLR